MTTRDDQQGRAITGATSGSANHVAAHGEQRRPITALLPAWKWAIAGLLSVCFALSYIDRQIISILIDPIKQSLRLTDTQIGLMQGVSFSLFYVAASLPLAWLSDRGHRSRVMAACVAGWSVMTMLCGLASTYWQMFLARIGVAVGEAGLPPAALTNLGDMFEARRLALATSIFMLAPFLGGGIALIGGGALYAATADWDLDLPVLGTLERWQAVFILVGAPGLLAAALIPWMTGRCPPAHKRAEKGAIRELLLFCRDHWRVVVVYALSIALVVALMMAYVTWLPAAIMRSKGVDEKTIGTLFGPIYMTSGIAGTLAAGFIVNAMKGDDAVENTLKFMRFCVVAVAPFAVFGPLVSWLWAELAFMGISIFLISSVNCLSSLPLQYLVPKHLRAQAIALHGMTCAMIGTGIGPVVAGILSDTLPASQPLSVALSLMALAILPMVAALLHSIIRRRATLAHDAASLPAAC